MKADTIRRLLPAPERVRPHHAVLAMLAIAGVTALSLVAMQGGHEARWAFAALFAFIAVASGIGALASAGVRFDRILPAPRTAALGLLGVVFLLAALATIALPKLDNLFNRGHPYGGAFYAGYQATLLEKGHLGTLTWQVARPIDGAVAQWAKDEAEIRASSLEGWFLQRPWYRRQFGVETEMLRKLAEKRLRLFSGSAPEWAPTARLCLEGTARFDGNRFTWDYNPGAVVDAKNYTQLLGREIKPADLLPLVPNGRCE